MAVRKQRNSDQIMEDILHTLGTIRRLEKAHTEAEDPRERRDIAETLDLLSPSLDLEVDKLAQALEQERKQKGAA